jgi:hypothetical protein
VTSARGICPTCLKEGRLTPQRQLLATHDVDGVKCEGSGSKPSEITRLASGAHPSSGSAPTRAVPRSTEGEFVVKGPESPSIMNDRNPFVECPTCLASVRVESGLLPVHFISGSPCVRSGTHVSTLSQVPHCPVCDRVVMRVDSAGYVAQHLRGVSGSFATCNAVCQRKPFWKSTKDTVTKDTVTKDTVTKRGAKDWLVLAAICLFVLWIPVSCVAGNISDGRRIDAAVSFECQQWVKAAKEHPQDGISGAPDVKGLDQSEIDKRVEAQCGDSRGAWKNWKDSYWATRPTTDPSPATESSPTTSRSQAECERDIAAWMDMDVDEQSRADSIDSIRIDCNMPPLQDDPFWQEAWQRHLEETGQTP